jgi:hypothetical protein
MSAKRALHRFESVPAAATASSDFRVESLKFSIPNTLQNRYEIGAKVKWKRISRKRQAVGKNKAKTPRIPCNGIAATKSRKANRRDTEDAGNAKGRDDFPRARRAQRSWQDWFWL